MLGIFAKVVQGEAVKTRLQTALSRVDAETFYVASLADTLETATSVVPHPTLFLQGGERADAVTHLRAALLKAGLDGETWSRCARVAQEGDDLGTRLERAFMRLDRDAAPGVGSVILGSDSPSLGSGKVRRALQTIRRPSVREPGPDVVLGPTADGGYWCIGLRLHVPGLLEQIAWSTERVLEQTLERARQFELTAELLEEWTDVDEPDDIAVLQQQIRDLRQSGDAHTARHVERALSSLGYSSNKSSKTL